MTEGAINEEYLQHPTLLQPPVHVHVTMNEGHRL